MRIRNVLVAAAVVVGVSAAPVAAQTSYVGGEDAEVEGNNFGRGGDQNDRGAVAGAADSRGLPITGGDVAGLSVVGFAAIGAGTVLVRRTRRRPATA